MPTSKKTSNTPAARSTGASPLDDAMDDPARTPDDGLDPMGRPDGTDAQAASAASPLDACGSLAATLGGPAAMAGDREDVEALPTESLRRLARAKLGAQMSAEAMPANRNKPFEHGIDGADRPPEGDHVPATLDDEPSASTVTEDASNEKLGDGLPPNGHNPTNGPLERVRVDSRDRHLTTNQGVAVADNQNSLKAGVRGPTLLEDFILREKITHFDHERIPERVVHARGSAAHGFFECYDSLAELTRADLFAEAGRRTPVFVRFSTVAGERGSADTVRDTRGFAVKFYTREGNWDLVGNNIPVFFVQDAMKFPDLVHAVKPEPHHAMPQASSAHDTFWDFISLMPESIHHTLWAMSDRGIPRSYRTMQGFGVHTFRLVNARGEARFVKFHWQPKAGTHSLVWDEAAKICGADPDFHRRDLWEAIEAGHYPEWELGLQVFTEEQAESFSFDVLDATKIVPEELVPIQVVGRLVLDRNPDNFFAETEQVAFCTAHVVPGIDFSNDPLLAGRHHSYLDTQLTRLGGPNFHEIPINSPVAQVHNNQRDGFHRQAIARGRVAYEPNSLAGGCPFQAGRMGFVTHGRTERTAHPAVGEPDKLRAKPEKFADHFSQAQLFYRSQTRGEQRHIASAFRFELSRVTVPAVRERVVSQLRNVDEALARQVAAELGMPLPPAAPLAVDRPMASEVEASAGLSLFARPGSVGAMGRKVAVLVAAGVDVAAARAAHQALCEAGAVPRFVGARLGGVFGAEDVPTDEASDDGAVLATEAATDGAGEAIVVETTIESSPSVVWDAVVLPEGQAAADALAADDDAVHFIREAWRHGKTLLAQGPAGASLLQACRIQPVLPNGEADPGLVVGGEPAMDSGDGDDPVLQRFLTAVARHRHLEREVALAP